ncbi:hypothetical protein D5086_015742 [Populus alba]|uniref:Uncharacterized protein n=1 Tax=Populus alba TaxID=43335 RepID=A0ACC4BSM3_POPAL
MDTHPTAASVRQVPITLELEHQAEEQHGNNGVDIYMGCGSSEPPYHDSSWSHRVLCTIMQLLMHPAAGMVRKKLSYGHQRSSL